MTKITIVHPNCNPKKIISQFTNSDIHWLSFNEDIDKIRNWEKNLSNHSKRLDISRDMESIYNDVYKEYSNLMADLGNKYNDTYPEWWLSPFSEKNGWPPKYVVNECIIEYVKKLLPECGNDEVILITSSTYNLVKLKKIAASEGIEYSIYGYKYFLHETIALYIRYLFEFLYFGFEFVTNKLWLMRYYKNDNMLANINTSNIAILRTYCHVSSFKDDGEYIDINFGDLKERLKKKGFEVIYQPNMSSISDKKRIYKWFSEKSRDKFWVLEKYLSFFDLGKAYTHILKQVLLLHKLGYAVFLNLEPLLVLNTGRNYLKSLVPVKLIQQKIEPCYVLFDWENKAYEKYMCIMFKKKIPKSKVVGYISGIPFPTGPEVNLILKEAEITPLPDKIVCKTHRCGY